MKTRPGSFTQRAQSFSLRPLCVTLLIFSFCAISAQAATRAIVPRATGEGSIGTSAKTWGSGYFSNLYVNGDVVGVSTGVLTVVPGTNHVAIPNVTKITWLNATPIQTNAEDMILQGVPPVGNSNAWSVLQAQVAGDITNLYWSPVTGPQGLPGGAYTNTAAYLIVPGTNIAQTFTVPAGVSNIYVKAWGAGGAPGGTAVPASGGDGGFAAASLVVTPLENLTIWVGKTGAWNNTAGVPGGGTGTGILPSYLGGGGGGYSGVFRGTNVLLIAAGGGGGGYGTGAGDGGSSLGATGSGTGAGTGGGQTSGGVTNGAFLQGGNAEVRSGNTGKGGGGGGYWGGGGGSITNVNSGGGGGSCYVPSGYGYMLRGYNSGDDDYFAGVGVGSTTYLTPSGDGYLKIFYP